MLAWRIHTGLPPEEDANAAFNLGDNPDNRLCWSAAGRIPAFRRSAGRVWFAREKRWLTDSERLACLGFPVTESLARAAKCPRLHMDSKQASHMAGNAWHVGNAGLVLTVALSCVEVVDA
jgi:hypothetical protein